MKILFLISFALISINAFAQVNCNDDNEAPKTIFVNSSSGIADSLGLIIYASDFIISASDNCTPASKLFKTFDGAYPSATNLSKEHYFKKNGIIASPLEYDLGLAQLWNPSLLSSSLNLNICTFDNKKPLSITVWDEKKNASSGINDFNLIAKDSSNCNLIKIFATKSNGKAINNFNVLFNANLAEFPIYFTNIDSVSINKFNIAPQTFCVELWKQDNVTNGITTKDLLALQNHILGIKQLNTPYKIIAADVNKDGKVNTKDLQLLRKILLGTITKLDTDPWVFINKNYVFTNPQNPFLDKAKWKSLDCFLWNNDSDVTLDFIGIKVGDVDESAKP